jgi:hypothetical protein
MMKNKKQHGRLKLNDVISTLHINQLNILGKTQGCQLEFSEIKLCAIYRMILKYKSKV